MYTLESRRTASSKRPKSSTVHYPPWRLQFIWIIKRVNDPSAGSPTETLLRLLLPLSDKVHKTSHGRGETTTTSVRIIHRITQSVGATGGVYKGQGRNQRKLVTYAY